MELLIKRLEDYRYDKPRPSYYARRTVTRAYARVALARGDNPESVAQTIRQFPPNPHQNAEEYARQTVQEFMAKVGRSNQRHPATRSQSGQHTHHLGFEVTP